MRLTTSCEEAQVLLFGSEERRVSSHRLLGLCTMIAAPINRDVFISYSTHDKDSAESIVKHLESNGISCWIAPRDVPPGKAWAASIVEGIDSATLLLLVFSQHADESPAVRREVERAVSKRRAILPVIISPHSMSKEMEFYLSSTHWHDAYSKPFEVTIKDILPKVRSLLLQEVLPAGMTKVGKRFKFAAYALSVAVLLTIVAAVLLTLPRWTTPKSRVDELAQAKWQYSDRVKQLVKEIDDRMKTNGLPDSLYGLTMVPDEENGFLRISGSAIYRREIVKCVQAIATERHLPNRDLEPSFTVQDRNALLALEQPITLSIDNQPLQKAMELISNALHVRVVLDENGFQKSFAGIKPEELLEKTVSLKLRNQPLINNFHDCLQPLDLTYFVGDGALMITSDFLNLSRGEPMQKIDIRDILLTFDQ